MAMETASAIQADRLDVLGGSLYYEVRGQGPVLLMMPGGPADTTAVRRIEEALAQDHTVVTYDPRGISHSSPVDSRDDDQMVEIFADDAGRLLAALGGRKASVFASSGGAVVALELVRTHSAQLSSSMNHPRRTYSRMARVSEPRMRTSAIPVPAKGSSQPCRSSWH
jgi:pimeloyl-ACP methyl ester carboxylesterase